MTASSFSLSGVAVSSAFISTNHLIACCLYQETASKSSDNLVLSPFSVQVAATLIYRGAKNKTSEEIKTCLKLPDSLKDVDVCIKEFFPKNPSKLHIFNKIYISDQSVVNNDFLKIAKNAYESAIDKVNFSDAKHAAKTINDWITKTKTQNTNLMEAKDLKDNTKLVSVNLSFFQGQWREKFKRALTADADFFKSSEEIVKVKTMRITDSFNYYSCKNVKAEFLEIFFNGNDVVMVVVLPSDKNTLSSLEKQIKQVLEPRDFTNELVDVYLPQFQIESNIDLMPVLQNAGIQTVFTQNAEISGICEKLQGIFVNKIMQKVYFDVNEDGAGVPLTSKIKLEAKSSRFSPNYKTFKADHPFLFYLKENDIVYCIGKVTNPCQV